MGPFMGLHYLSQLLHPKSIAVFGASEKPNAVGTLVFRNMLEAGFTGNIYPINPKHTSIQGHDAYPSLEALNKPVDLVVIATPAKTVPGIMFQCGEHGVKGVVIMSAGFSESGNQGEQLEKEVLNIAQRHNIHIIGPNCLGIMRPSAGLNATFSNNQAYEGKLALVSQSGAMCTAVLDWASKRKLGFSAVITLGDAADVDFGDVLDFLALDSKTSSILLYIEGIHNARGFVSGLRAASRMKPVVVLKTGRFEEGFKAATSHTGAIVGGDDVFNAALERAGVVRAKTITQLFSAAEILASGITVQQNRLAIVTNGGGPGVMATDRAVEMNLRMANLSDATIEGLNKVLPPTWSHNNPIDIIGDATPERYEAALRVCMQDEGLDGILVMLTPQAMTDPKGVAEAVIRVAKESNKPVLACWMGEEQVERGRRLFEQAHIPQFRTPESAVEAFAYLATHRSNQKLLMQVSTSVGNRLPEPDVAGARLIIQSVLSEGRRSLSTTESRAILSAFHIPYMPTMLARSPSEALVAAESLGFPVVMKISSPDISHKSDVNGVRLNIVSAHAVRSVYQELVNSAKEVMPDARIEGVTIEKMHASGSARELMIGVLRDPVFGPVISFGSGGTAVELHKDSAVVLPPLNDYLITKAIQRTRVAKALEHFRNMPAVNMEMLKEIMKRVSQMVCELPEIREMDINPLVADENGVIAVDARFAIDYPATMVGHYDHMAIHPYPNHLSQHTQLSDGTDVLIRPMRPEDAEMEQKFVRNLSKESRYMRFMQTLNELTPDMLVRLTQIDYDREIAFVAITRKHGQDMIIGVGRYAINPDKVSCEFALVVADDWHNRGLGGLLMGMLMDAARKKGLHTMEGEVLSNNSNMLSLIKRLHFTSKKSTLDDGVMMVSKRIAPGEFG
jgi:acetyltransferase